jgi:hypothetical protein
MRPTISSRVVLLVAALASVPALTPPVSAAPPPKPDFSRPTWSDITTGAAMGYCLAKHPYKSLAPGVFYLGDPYTSDGYEMVALPGVIGAVRRNFVYSRTTLGEDEGNKNFTCEKACSEFGKQYAPNLKGVPLKQRLPGVEKPMNSGIGEMAELAMPDRDFYLGTNVFAGIWSRGNSWQEDAVAQADFCCCQSRAEPAGSRTGINIPLPPTVK